MRGKALLGFLNGRVYAYTYNCIPANQYACIHVCLSTCVLVYLHTCIPVCLYTRLVLVAAPVLLTMLCLVYASAFGLVLSPQPLRLLDC